MISNRRCTLRCNVVSAFFNAKICSLLARRRSSQPIQRVYWPENVIDWLGKWRPTCVMRHARGQKLQSFRRKWPFYCIWIFILCSVRKQSYVNHQDTVIQTPCIIPVYIYWSSFFVILIFLNKEESEVICMREFESSLFQTPSFSRNKKMHSVV